MAVPLTADVMWLYVRLISSYFKESLHMAESWQLEKSRINPPQGFEKDHSMLCVCVCMRGYKGSSVCRCLRASSRPFQDNLSCLRSNLMAAEIAMLSGSKLQLWWTGLTSSWLHCPLQQGPTSSVYSCALKASRQGKRSGNFMLCVPIDVSCFFPAVCACVSGYPSVSLCTSVWWSVMQVHACVGFSPSLLTLA